MFKSTFNFRNMFLKLTKRKASSAMAEAQVVSSSNLSPEMEARMTLLPKSWRGGCRKVMEEQTPELQLIQIVIYKGLISLADSLSFPPPSSNIKEIAHESPRLVTEDDLNMEDCLGWFRGTQGENDDEEEDDEDFDDDPSYRWFPDEWRTSSELVQLHSDSPRILPDNLRQVEASNVIVEDTPTFLDHSALPILILPPPPIPTQLAWTRDTVKPLQRAVRTKRRNGISVASARTSFSSRVVVLPHPTKTKTKTVTLKKVKRRTNLSVRTSATQDWQHPGGKQPFPEGDSRELQRAEPCYQFPTDISYGDFAHELDERRTMFNGTSALAQLPVLPLRRRPATSTKRVVSLTEKRPTSYSGRWLVGKENWHRLDTAPLLQRAIPTTLGVVIPRVKDSQPSNWCHLAVDVSYGDFANGLDERRMLLDDASTIMQDWD